MKDNTEVTGVLGYHPPYRWEEILKFLAGRAIKGIDVVKNGEYLRTVHLVSAEGKHVYGWISVSHTPQKSALNVRLSESLLPVLPVVSARVRHLFDLNCDPDAVYQTLSSMNTIRPNLCILGTRLPGCFDAFEMAVRTVLGQQISVKAASTLAARIVAALGTSIQTGIEGLTHIFPSPEDILALEGTIENRFGTLGVIAARSRTIYALARVIAQKEIDFDPCTSPEDEIEKLMVIRGIGSWSAQYIAMRAMAYSDAFLETDAGVKKALGPYTSKELLKLAEAWRPWRSYATVNLWNSL